MSTERELATHEAEIKHLQADMDKLVTDMDEIKSTLLEVQKTLAEAKGGWRILMMFGGAGGMAGAWVLHLLQSWFGK